VADGEDRVLTVPNALSLGRLACVPVFLWLLFRRRSRGGAAVLLGTLGITDWVDGYVARRFDQVSTVGKVLDPTADRVLLVVGIFAILVEGAVPRWIAWLAVSREITVGAGALTLAAMGARRVDVTWEGKCGTFALMVAFPLFLLSTAPSFPLKRAARLAAWPIALIGLGYSWYSVAGYVPVARAALAGPGLPAEGQNGDRVGSAR
jgi:cardiolipin synthase